MAQKIINTKIREAYDTEANWIKHNPVLLAGQLAFSSDKYGKYKIGNGASRWSELPYNTLNWTDITGKPSSFTPSSHTHVISQITDIKNASVNYATTAGAVPWSGITGKPSSFPPSSHTHTASQITGLPTRLPNPQTLTIRSNDTNTSVDYTGAEAKTLTMSPEWVYGASDAPLSKIAEYSEKVTRYVKVLDIESDKYSLYGRVQQQFLIMGLNFSFILNLCAYQFNSKIFNNYSASYITTSANGVDDSRFLLGVKNINSESNKIELWYKQDQWTSALAILPKGRSGDTTRVFNLYSVNNTDHPVTTAPVFDISIPIKNNYKIYTTTGNAIDGAMTQQAVTIALETRALKEHSHTIYNITNLQSTLDGKAPTTHEHNFLRVSDTRNENPTPNNDGFKKNSVAFDFKSAAKINSPTNNAYVGLMSFAPWSETSGGNGYQMAFGYLDEAHNTTPKLMLRTADLSATTWGAWYKIYTSADKPTLAELGAAASSHTHSNYATTTNLSLANQRIDAHEKELGVHKTLIDGKASVSHNHDTIYAKSSHYHDKINDCNSGTSIGISSTLGIVPSVSEKYDIVVTNTSEFGNKFVTMDKDSFIDKIPLKAITNSQIDSLASL